MVLSLNSHGTEVKESTVTRLGSNRTVYLFFNAKRRYQTCSLRGTGARTIIVISQSTNENQN